MITINKTSLQQATEFELRALEAGRAGVNRTRAANQQLADVAAFVEYHLNEVLLPNLLQAEPAASDKVKEIAALLAGVSDAKRDAVLAELKK